MKARQASARKGQPHLAVAADWFQGMDNWHRASRHMHRLKHHWFVGMLVPFIKHARRLGGCAIEIPVNYAKAASQATCQSESPQPTRSGRIGHRR